jgi:hypothetical protein
MYGAVCIGAYSDPKFDLDLTFPKLFLRVDAKRLAKFRKDHLPTVNQDNANFAWINPAIVRQALTGEIIDGADDLDTGETTSHDHEREHPLPPSNVGFDTSGFQHRNHTGPQHHRIAERLDAYCTFAYAWDSRVVGLRPKR